MKLMRKICLRLLPALLGLVLLTQAATAANVIVLIHYGRSYTFDNLADAMTCMMPGDTIDIQDFDGPLNTGLMADYAARPSFPTWATVKCSKPTPATIICTKWFMGTADHWRFENLILQGGGAVVFTGLVGDDPHASVSSSMFCMGGANSTFTDCTFTSFTEAGVRVTSCDNAAPLRFSHCYFHGNAHSALKQDREFFPKKKPDNVILDHCTLVSGDECVIYGDPTLEGTDYVPGSNLTVTNSILVADSHHRPIVAFGTTALEYTHHHNALVTNWPADWWNKKERTQAGEGDLVVQGLDFRNPKAGDWRLANSPRNARLRGAGEGGTTIGADRAPVRRGKNLPAKARP